MDMDNGSWELHLFRPVKPLFKPSLIAPLDEKYIQINLQFVIPGLRISKKDKNSYYKLLNLCLDGIWNSSIIDLEDHDTKAKASHVEIAFYMDSIADAIKLKESIDNKSRILVERFLGVLSFCAGNKLCAKNIVPTIISNDNGKLILNAAEKTERPPIKFELPREIFDENKLSKELFAALFWLRRGLAEHDPIDTFNAFTICLQILARHWWDRKMRSDIAFEKTQTKKCAQCEKELPLLERCPNCGKDLLSSSKYPPPSFLFKEYLKKELNANPGIANEVWKKRNAIVAHGNKSDIDADDFKNLTELKFKAAEWTYQGINLALGLELETAPKLSHDFLVTDSLMNLD